MLMWTLALGDVMERVFGVSGVVRVVGGGLEGCSESFSGCLFQTFPGSN